MKTKQPEPYKKRTIISGPGGEYKIVKNESGKITLYSLALEIKLKSSYTQKELNNLGYFPKEQNDNKR